MPTPIPVTDLTGTDIDPLKMKPIGKNVLLHLAEQTPTTEGGIVLPDETSDPVQVGTVVSTGKNVTDVAVGTHLQFAKYCPGPEFTKDTERFKLVHELDLIGAVTA